MGGFDTHWLALPTLFYVSVFFFYASVFFSLKYFKSMLPYLGTYEYIEAGPWLQEETGFLFPILSDPNNHTEIH